MTTPLRVDWASRASEHYALAEDCLAEADREPLDLRLPSLTRAQVHATLAVYAALTEREEP